MNNSNIQRAFGMLEGVAEALEDRPATVILNALEILEAELAHPAVSPETSTSLDKLGRDVHGGEM